MKIKLISLLTVTAFSSVFALRVGAADPEAAPKPQVFKGTALCAKCALGQSDTCQSALQVQENGKTVTYLLADTPATSGFHSNICQKSLPAWTMGVVREVDGKKQIVAQKIGLQQEVTLNGKALCAKCALHETDTCQNALQVEADGKTVTYYLDPNKVSKDFHDTVCQGPENAVVKGTVAKINDRWELVAKSITTQ